MKKRKKKKQRGTHTKGDTPAVCNSKSPLSQFASKIHKTAGTKQDRQLIKGISHADVIGLLCRIKHIHIKSVDSYVLGS